MGLLDDDAPSRNALGDRGDIVTLTVKEWLKFFIVGLFPWLAVNGVFAELAVFNRYMPEHKKLSSQAGMACQIANISLVYVYLRRVYRDSFISIRTTVWLLLFLNCVSCVALALFWRVTNGEHSIVILLCTFTGGIVGILSIVTLYPWATSFQQPRAVSAISTGTAASSLIGSLLGLAQGAGEISQRFSPFVYMLLLSLVALASSYCFYLLNSNRGNSRVNTMDLENTVGNHNSSIVTSLIEKPSKTEATGGCPNELTMKELLLKIISPIFVQFLNCTLNYALLPGIIPFLTCGHTLTFWFTLLISFSNVLGRFISTFYQNTDHLLPFLTFVMVILFALGMFLAGSGVTTKKHSINEIFAGIGVALFAALNGYIESLVFLVPSRILERETEGSKEMALQAVGVCGQVGAFIGTLSTAGLVSGSAIFHQC